MLPDLVLHLVLLRRFQLPINLRFIMVENYFPFLPKERAPFLTPMDVGEGMNYQSAIALFHHIPIGNNNSEEEEMIKDGDSAFVLCLRKEGRKVHAMIGRGNYIAWGIDKRIVFIQKEVLYVDSKMVMLSLDAGEACDQKNIQKMKHFYRKWILVALDGVGYFSTRGWSFDDFTVT